MNIKPFKALYPNLKLVPSPKSFFDVMKKEFPHYLRNGFFKRTKTPHLFLYKIVGKNNSSYGLICSTDVKDITDGLVLKHENTIASKEQQMLDLALQRNAMIKPVLLGHPHNDSLHKLYTKIEANKPFLNLKFKEEKSEHMLWKIKDEDDQQKIISIFSSDIPASYIADGHHRVSTGILLNKSKQNTIEYGDLLSIYMSFNDLHIYDYSRVVTILNEISSAKLMALMAKYFKIKPLDKLKRPKSKFEITLLIGKEVFLLKWKKKYIQSDKAVILDAELLNEHIFKQSMGIKDVRFDSRIQYIGGQGNSKEMKAEILKNDYAIGFMMYPVHPDELMKLADSGETLPPKSTWFEPRIKNAIIAQEFK
jgi:uncharacterized protein (DUF1015 family)